MDITWAPPMPSIEPRRVSPCLNSEGLDVTQCERPVSVQWCVAKCPVLGVGRHRGSHGCPRWGAEQLCGQKRPGGLCPSTHNARRMFFGVFLVSSCLSPWEGGGGSF